MNSFVTWNDWWTQKYRFKIGEGIRYFSMKVALNLFNQRYGNIIVETGTTRALNDMGGAGMATIILGDYCKTYNKKLWTVDILPEAIELCKGVTEEYKENITYVVADSVVFLDNFRDKIDFLYLDSMDCPIDFSDMLTLEQSQQHQLKELKAAWPRIHDNSVILLDDNGFPNGGKCKLTKEFLTEKKWICLLDDYQSLWISK